MYQKLLQRTVYFLQALLLVFSVPIFANPADQLTSLLGSFTTYQASFKQWTVNDQHQVQSQSSGTFAIERPNKFRWQTAAPNNELIIANGDKLWHYDASLMQATEQTLQPGTQTQNPAMLLSSKVHDLANTFAISAVTLQNQQWFKLLPKKTTSYQAIYLHFLHHQLTKIIVVNNLGERSLFQFSNIKLNQTLPSSEFTFKPPRGVDVDVQN